MPTAGSSGERSESETFMTDSPPSSGPQPTPVNASLEAARQMRFEDFVRFFKENTDGSCCPYCRKDDWHLILPSDDGFVTVPLTKTGAHPALASVAMPCIVMECSNCGHVRLHSAGHIGHWMLNQGKNNE